LSNNWIRPFHRWMSVAFTLGVVVVFIAMGSGEPAPWIYALPALPLAVLQLTGMYLFVQPYLAKRRGGRAAPASQQTGG
jgi:hypothetical protein